MTKLEIFAGCVFVAFVAITVVFFSTEDKPKSILVGNSFTYQTSIIPVSDSTYTLGTTSKAWLNLYTDQICLAGDCQTAWPSSSGAWPFTTSDTNYGVPVQSTTTPEWFKNGLQASSTSHFVNASTTNITALGSVWIPNLTSALVLAGSDGLLTEFSGATCNSGDVAYGIATDGDVLCQGVTTTEVSGLDISDDTNLAATYPVILTGDTLSFPATSTLYGTGTAGYVLGWTNGGPGWVATSSAIAWGAITGTLSSQTDLNAKFLTKLGTSSALTANEVVYATAFNTVASIATGTLSCTSPVSCTSRAVLQGASAISIANAAADGSTKGAASFTAADFDASSGNISLDRAITGTFTGAWAFTNAASTTIAKGLYANTIAASYLMATSTTAWSTLPNIRITNASTTNVSVSQSLFVAGNQVTGERYINFDLATSTLWTGSSTANSLGDKFKMSYWPRNGTITGFSCDTNAGTLGINVTNGTWNWYFVASTTNNYNATSAPMTAGQQLTVTAGNASGAPTTTPCLFVATGF